MIKTEWSSRSLFARSLGLLRSHLVLSLPVIVADVIGFAERDAMPAIRESIFAWLFRVSEQDSVLSASRSTFAMSPKHLTIAASVIGAALQLNTQFIKVFLYSGALLITSGLLLRIQAGDGSALNALRGRGRELVRFSLVVLGGVIVMQVVAALLFAVLMNASGGRFDLGKLAPYATLLEIPLGYLIARPGVMLVWRKDESPSPSAVRLARLFAMGTIVAQFLIALMIGRVIYPAFYQLSGAELIVRDALISAVGAIPFMVSFIAFSVLGSEDGRMDGEPVTEIIPAEGL